MNALATNGTGNSNAAFGVQALRSNNDGNNNTAAGYDALYSNTNGASNTAAGRAALYANTTGYHNTAAGAQALYSNSTGADNVALGFGALHSNTTERGNIAIGDGAGQNLTSGSGNIDIANAGVVGDIGTIRIGSVTGQSKTYIAGVATTHITGSAVYVTSGGQLGVLASSERYKTAIVPMAGDSAKLKRLRPISFHLKNEPQGPVQYGLIADDVAKVYPELVIRDVTGTIEGVCYDELSPLLLNEVQKQDETIEAQARELKELRQQVAALRQVSAALAGSVGRLQAGGARR